MLELKDHFSNSPFLQELWTKARSQPGQLFLPEGDDPRVQEAGEFLLHHQLVRSVHTFAKKGSSALTIHSPEDSEFLEPDRPLRPKKGDASSGPQGPKGGELILWQAGSALHAGQVDAVVAGCVHPTSLVIKASLNTVGLAARAKRVSGAFVMEHSKTQTLWIFSDCGVNIAPSPEVVCDIAEQAWQLWQDVTRSEARLAFLSFSTHGSAKHAQVDETKEALHLFRKRHPEVLAEGEMQFDAAVHEGIARRKMGSSLVGGKANIFIFPNLAAGNIGYKMAQYLGGFSAYGPLLLGTAKPYFDLSRGASVQDIIIISLIALAKAKKSDP